MCLPKKRGERKLWTDHRRKSDRRMSRYGSLMQMILWIVSLPFGPWFKQCRCSYSCHAKNWSSYDFWWSLELLTNDQHGSLLSLMTAKYRWLNVCYWRPSCLILYWRPSLSLSLSLSLPLLSPLIILCWPGDHGKGVENHSTTSPLYSCIYLWCNASIKTI